MTTAGPNACGTGSNYNDGGDNVWSNPTNIQVDDTSVAATSTMDNGKTSQGLYAQNFGFAIASGATITNISFSYKRYAASANRVTESSIKMLDATGTPAGNEKADAVTYWSSAEETITKSGDGTYWGVSLTPALVNDVDFGLKIKATVLGSVSSHPHVQFASCTVSYTLGGVPKQAMHYARLRHNS